MEACVLLVGESEKTAWKGRSEQIITWEKMKREIKRKYLPKNYWQDIFLKIHSLRQRDLSVEDYTTEFDQLIIKGEFEEREEHNIAWYLSGLNYEFANVVNLQPYFSLHDVMKLALKVEKWNKVKRVVSTRYGVRSEITKGLVLKHLPPPNLKQSLNH